MRRRETTDLPTKEPAAMLGAIGYLAVLAYPDRSEWNKRDEFVRAAKALLLQISIKRGYPRRKVPPEYRRYRSAKTDGVLGKGFRRIYDRRLIAALIAERTLPPFQFSIARLLRGLVAGEERRHKSLEIKSALDNRYHRIWAESLPVLHLTLVIVDELQKQSENPMRLIYNHSWLVRSLKEAEQLVPLLQTHIPSFHPERAICLIPKR